MENLRKAIREPTLAGLDSPETLIANNGTQFRSSVFYHYLKKIEVEQQFTVSYAHNRPIMRE